MSTFTQPRHAAISAMLSYKLTNIMLYQQVTNSSCVVEVLPVLTEWRPATPRLVSRHLVVKTLIAPPKKYCTPRQPM